MILLTGAMKKSANNHWARLWTRTGFTLIELLFVIIVLGIIAGLAVPNFSRSFSSLQLTQTAEDISFLMRYAQGRAATQKVFCRLNFDLKQKTYWLSQSDEEEIEKESLDSFQPIAGKMGRVFSIPEGVTLETETPQINFYPDGKCDQGRLYVSDSKGRYQTIVLEGRMGRVQIYDEKWE